jgi:hypothetical protein
MMVYIVLKHVAQFEEKKGLKKEYAYILCGRNVSSLLTAQLVKKAPPCL